MSINIILFILFRSNKEKEEVNSTKRRKTVSKPEQIETKKQKKEQVKILKEYCHICGVIDTEMFKCKTCKTSFCFKCEFKEKIPCLLNQQKKCCVCARTCDCKRCNNKKRFPVPLEVTSGFPHLPRHGTRIYI